MLNIKPKITLFVCNDTDKLTNKNMNHSNEQNSGKKNNNSYLQVSILVCRTHKYKFISDTK